MVCCWFLFLSFFLCALFSDTRSLRAALLEMFPNVNMMAQPEAEDAAAVLKDLDLDGNGVLTFDEFIHFAKVIYQVHLFPAAAQ